MQASSSLVRQSLALSVSILAFGCSVDDGSDGVQPFVIRTLGPSVLGNAPVAVSGSQMAFLASEATTGPEGTNWNEATGDEDTSDQIVFMATMDAVSPSNATPTPEVSLGVAAASSLAPERTLALANGTLFLVVDEAGDTRDWNEDLDTEDRVLCYARPGATDMTFLAELDDEASLPMIQSAADVFFQGPDGAPGSGRTNLFRVEVASFGGQPSEPAQIATQAIDAGDDGVLAALAADDSGVIAVTLDEAVNGELNGDGLADDAFVLGLIDSSDDDALLVVTGFSVSGSDPALQAVRADDDALVAFLVDEESMDVNYNTTALLGMAWQPTQCQGQNDSDTSDQVLHWLRLGAFEDDPISDPAVNTGLVGTGQIFTLGDEFVGVVSFETDEGSGGGCDLNGNGFSNDRVFRWVSTAPGALPPGDASRLHAVEFDLAGGSGGVIGLNERVWVLAVDESSDGRDLNGDGLEDRSVIGVLDPVLTGTDFNFDQGGEVFAEPTWMAPDLRTPARFLMALTERSVNADNNGDGDSDDSVPTFPFEAAPRELDFPGAVVAVSEGNAGLVTAAGFGFYRAREASQGSDFNNDEDFTDFALLRISLSGSEPTTFMGVLHDVNRPSVEAGPSASAVGVAWVIQEAQQGTGGFDFNSDGDEDDFVVRFTTLP